MDDMNVRHIILFINSTMLFK